MASHARLALLLALPGELDDQNRVLAREPGEHEEADLREHVVVAAGEPDAGDRREQRHRHDQDHAERQRPALVLRGEHDVDEQHAQREDEDHRVAREQLLIRELGPLEGHARRQLAAASTSAIACLRLARAEARRRTAVDLGGRIAVVVHHLIGPVAARFTVTSDPSGTIAPCALRVSRRRICSGCRRNADFGLRVDLIGAAEAIEVVHVERAEIDLQRLEDVGQRHAVGLHALAIDVGVDLRHVHLEAREQAGERRRAAAPSASRACSCAYSSSKPALPRSSTYSLKPPTCAEPLHRRRREDRDERFLDRRRTCRSAPDDRAGAESSAMVRSSDGFSVTNDDAGVRRVDEAVDRQPGKRDRAGARPDASARSPTSCG